jgi:hypothetical protein
MLDNFERVAEVSEVPQRTTNIVKVGGAELFVANVGNFTVSGMDDDMTKRIAMSVLELAFNEDNENLRKLTVTA